MTTAIAFWLGVSVGAAGLVAVAVLAGLVYGIIEDRRRIYQPWPLK